MDLLEQSLKQNIRPYFLPTIIICNFRASYQYFVLVITFCTCQIPFNLKLAPSRIFHNCTYLFIMYSLFTISPATFFRWVGNSTHFSHISPNSFSVTFFVNQLAQTQGNILYTTKYCLSPFKLILFANSVLFTTTIVLLQPNYSKMMYVDCIRNVE